MKFDKKCSHGINALLTRNKLSM